MNQTKLMFFGCLASSNDSDFSRFRLDRSGGWFNKGVNSGQTIGLRVLLTVTLRRAISADILHFPARVLVRQAATSWNTQRLCSRAGFCPSTRATCDSPFSGLRPVHLSSLKRWIRPCWGRCLLDQVKPMEVEQPVAVRSNSRSTLHGHATAYG